MCHIRLILVTTIVLATYVSSRNCPLDFVCPCDELEDTKHGSIVHVKCKRQNLTDVPDLQPLRDLKIHKLDLSDNPISELKDFAFSGLRFVKWYELSSPEILLDRLPLTSISYNAFNDISAEALRLQLIDCQITEAPLDQLKKIPNITRLQLENNQMSAIPDKSFAMFKKLAYLDLSGSRLGDLTADMFTGLENCVESLILMNVGMESFPLDALKKLKKLTRIDLSNNGILSLPLNMFQGWKTKDKFLSLNLSGNKLKTISPLTFSKTGVTLRLVKLQLQYNYLKHVEFLYDPCSTVFQPNRISISLEGNPLVCDCDFYSAVDTGIYTVSGRCESPEAYSGQEVLVWDAVVNAHARYQTEYGDLATAQCGGNQTEWDLKCGKWVSYNINGAVPLGYNPSLPLGFVIAIVATSVWCSKFQ